MDPALAVAAVCGGAGAVGSEVEREFENLLAARRVIVPEEAELSAGLEAAARTHGDAGFRVDAARVELFLELPGSTPHQRGQRREGQADEYRRQQDAVLAAAEAGRVDPMEAVWAVLEAGDLDEAAAWLEQAIEARSRDVLLVHHLQALAALRDHPRIAALLPVRTTR